MAIILKAMMAIVTSTTKEIEKVLNCLSNTKYLKIMLFILGTNSTFSLSEIELRADGISVNLTESDTVIFSQMGHDSLVASGSNMSWCTPVFMVDKGSSYIDKSYAPNKPNAKTHRSFSSSCGNINGERIVI